MLLQYQMFKMEELKKKLKKVNAFKYILEKEGNMNVPVEIYISEDLINIRNKDPIIGKIIKDERIGNMFI